MYYSSFRAIALSSLFIAALLTACGGGGGGGNEATEGGGGVPVMQADSEDCFNRGMYTAGSVIELDRRNNDFVSSYLREVKPYIGINSTPSMVQVRDDRVAPYFESNPVSLHTIEADAYVEYGGLLLGARQWHIPPVRRPIKMQPGEIYHHEFISRTYLDATPDILDSESNAIMDRKYVGREVIETALGRFETCRFEIKTIYPSRDGYPPISSATTSWIAATPPYRGLVLKYDNSQKTEGKPATELHSQVIKVTKFELK